MFSGCTNLLIISLGLEGLLGKNYCLKVVQNEKRGDQEDGKIKMSDRGDLGLFIF
jgi:hypothetical protein